VGAQRALGRGTRSVDELDASLVGLMDRVTRRLRRGQRVARTVVLRLRFADYTRATRSRTVAEATAETDTLLHTARTLLWDALPLIRAQGITLIGVSVTNLQDAHAVQLALPLEGPDRHEVDAVVDGIRARFGTEAITRGTLVGANTGMAAPTPGWAGFD
jgi:DNA polymerase-4